MRDHELAMAIEALDPTPPGGDYVIHLNWGHALGNLHDHLKQAKRSYNRVSSIRVSTPLYKFLCAQIEKACRTNHSSYTRPIIFGFYVYEDSHLQELEVLVCP